MKYQKNILKVIFLLAAWAILTMDATPVAVSGEMDPYCSTPPFIGNAVPPNVLIVLDNSGSMCDQAYAGSYDTSGFTSGYYYGYFDGSKNYRYSNNNRWEETTDAMTTGTTANPIASGSFLNWATMRRVEVAKKLLIGGKGNPRSWNGSVTVKLTGETACGSSWNFQKDYDTSAQNLIYPFNGNYRFTRSSDDLSISPVSAGTQTFYTYPTSDISVPAGWSEFPAAGAITAWDKVDEAVSDIDVTYIQNSNTTSPVILDYDYTQSKPGGTITVTVKVRARRTGATTRRIQGVLRISGVDYPSNYSNISSTSYLLYSFTWTTNPATGLAWDWNDIKSSGVGSLQGFGVQAYALYTSQYPRVTQVYFDVSVSNPSGGPYSTIVDMGSVDATGIIDTLSDSARFGLAYYASSNNGGKIDTYVDFGAATSMITSISGMTPSTWTPLGETLYEMTRYFRQDAPYYSNSPADYQTGLNYDPYYFNYTDPGKTDQYVPCAKSFVLFLTDGESTQDTSIPGTSTSSPYAACSLTNIKACSGYGGLPNPRFAGTAIGTTYASSGTDYMIDVAYWARTNDMRSGSCTTTPTSWQQCIPGTQNVILYPVFLFGSGLTLLKDAAIYGGFNDLNGDGKPGPDLKEYLRDSNGDGVITSADLPITYYEGDDGYALEASITEAIASILRRAASGTAVSVLTTSSRGVGSLVQAYFLPIKQEGTREVTWTGYTQNIWIDPKDNLREDTVNDYNLKLDEDLAIKLFFDTAANETKAATFTTDANGENGTLASCSSPTIKSFADVTYLWEAGKKLALKAPSTRTLFTSAKVLKTSGTATITTNTTNIPTNTFTSLNITGDATLSAALTPNVTYTADNIVRYIMGECLETGVNGDTACGGTAGATYRDRRVAVSGGGVNGNTWKLGDIISSTPKVFANTPLNTYHIDYGDSTYYNFITSDSYKKKSSIAFMGANDGMLHAFRVGYLKDTGLAAGIKALFKDFFGTTGTNNIGTPESADTANTRLGEEVWGYIPFNAFPYLKYLADPTYCHIYYNDLSVRLVDVSIGGNAALNGTAGGTLPTDTRTDGNWKTVLIGGMRFGAACSGGTAPTGPPPGTPANVGFSSYYAIDITDPETPVPLWEFSDDDMGYSTTFPSIVRTGDKTKNGNWYVAFGSGSKQLPKGTTDIARTTTGYVYLLDLRTGTLVNTTKIALNHNAIVGDILAIDADKDYHSEKIYFGTSYLSTTWKGKLVSIDVPNQDLTTAWTPTIKYLFADSYPFTASTDVAKDADGNVWVYAGSGKYFSGVDQTDTSGQIFLGIKDAPSGITYPQTIAGLDNRTATNTTGTVTGTSQVCMYDSTAGEFQNKTIVTSITPTSATVTASTVGWYLSLTDNGTGERVITRPLAVGGLVDFLTYKPSSDVCSYGGNSYLYAVGYTTGVAPTNIAIMAPATTGGTTSGTVTVAKGILLGPGAPPTGEAIIIPPPKEGQETLKKKIQIATGVIIEAENTPVTSVISKVVHWLRK